MISQAGRGDSHGTSIAAQQQDRPLGSVAPGVIVNEIGMRPLITEFQQKYIWPVVAWQHLVLGSHSLSLSPSMCVRLDMADVKTAAALRASLEAKVLFPEQAGPRAIGLASVEMLELGNAGGVAV